MSIIQSMIEYLGFAAVIFYLACTGSLVNSVRSTGPVVKTSSALPIALSAAALCLHALAIYPEINTPAGYDFSFFKVAALIFLLMGLLGTTSLASGQAVHSLLMLLFPLSALALACSLLFDSTYTAREMDSGLATHVILSVVALGILTAAALQASLLFVQMQLLKGRQTQGLIDYLPPLQTMEQLLFQCVWAGFVLLSLALALGIIYVEDLFAQHLVHKTLFSVGAWLVFATLLYGRHQLGWRGKSAVQWTLAGLALLAVGFFGSKLVLEIILQRG